MSAEDERRARWRRRAGERDGSRIGAVGEDASGPVMAFEGFWVVRVVLSFRAVKITKTKLLGCPCGLRWDYSRSREGTAVLERRQKGKDDLRCDDGRR